MHEAGFESQSSQSKQFSLCQHVCLLTIYICIYLSIFMARRGIPIIAYLGVESIFVSLVRLCVV